MSAPYKPFDVATKSVIEADPLAWLQFLGLPGETATLFDPELSSFVADADKMLMVTDSNYLVHIEAQSKYKHDLGNRTLFHNVVAFRKYGLPVESVIILLRREADSPEMTGRVRYGRLLFEYEIVRIWEKLVEEMLAAPLALLPLALLTDASETDLPSVIQQMETRRETEAEVDNKEDFGATAMLLMGLKFDAAFALELLTGCHHVIGASRTFDRTRSGS